MFFAAISTILFCSAVTVLFQQAASYQRTLNLLEERNRESDALYEARYEVEELTAYTELIMSLYQQLEYDLQIEDLTIHKNEHTIDKIESYHIKQGSYRKSYQYDESGCVNMIIYKLVEETT